ncbi:SseB family protein [Lactovum odontotermitis]
MGLFDFFKDGDNYEGAHDSRRSASKKPSAFDVSEFDSNADLIAWLEKNKVILLSEDEGLVVYSNDKNENFLQLYTSTSEAKDEDLDEYVEVTGEDLRDLLDEMPDISHFVLNPASNNILIRREEILDPNSPMTSKPVEREHEHLAGSEAVSNPMSHEASSEIASDALSETDLETVSETAESDLDSIPTLSAASEITDEGSSVAENQELVPEKEEAEPVIQPEREQDPSVNTNEEKEVEVHMNFETVTAIPQAIIATTLSLAKAGVQKFYLAQENQGDFSSLFFLAGTDQEIDSADELIGVKFYHQDGSEEAQALENDKFLIFDRNAAEQLAENTSEGAVLYYFGDHPIIYTTPIQKNENGAAELLAFSDFSQIPELFLNAFDSFELSSLEQFNAFLESDDGRVDVIHLNPFTVSLFLKPEAFKPVTAPLPASEAEISDEISFETPDKKAVISKVLETLKDFDIANIALAADDQVSFTFRKKQDVAVAKQILRMKTDLKV